MVEVVHGCYDFYVAMFRTEEQYFFKSTRPKGCSQLGRRISRIQVFLGDDEVTTLELYLNLNVVHNIMILKTTICIQR